jgi:hypothetical protein
MIDSAMTSIPRQLSLRRFLVTGMDAPPQFITDLLWPLLDQVSVGSPGIGHDQIE